MDTPSQQSLDSLLWGSMVWVGYPSDSVASCSPSFLPYPFPLLFSARQHNA